MHCRLPRRWRVKRSRRHPVTALLLVFTVLVGVLAMGCDSGLSPEVRELLTEAKSHYDKAVEAVKVVSGLQKRLNDLSSAELTPETIAQVKKIISAARQGDEVALKEVKEAGSALLEIKDIDASREMKTYVGLRTAALREQEKLVQLDLERMDLGSQVLTEIETNAPVEQRVATLEKLQQVVEEYTRQDSRVQALHRDAADYYEEKKLGR